MNEAPSVLGSRGNPSIGKATDRIERSFCHENLPRGKNLPMRLRLFFLLAASGLSAHAQPWSTILDPSRAIDWRSAGFTIPSYTVNCPTQPTLQTGSSKASANTTAIQNALASCTATQNVVNIPAGTYYVAGIGYGTQGNEVIRGAGPNSTTLIPTTENNCGGLGAGICMMDANPVYNQSSQILPGGNQQCTWSGTNGSAGTYTQGATTINLTGCGGAPPLHNILLMDQANDSTDTNGVYVCDSTATNCVYDGGGSIEGRTISGKDRNQLQATYVTGVTSLGGGAYSVTVSPGVYFNNIRSSQSPGVWWSSNIQNSGLENLTVDGSSNGDYTVGMYDCYQCWVKNVRFLNGGRASVIMFQSSADVIRDSYFYQAQGHQQVSYNIESQLSSAFLIENNIFQQVTTPLTFNTATGAVVNYNFSVDMIAFPNYAWAAYASHNAGNNMNLFEGNSFMGIVSDNAWGSSVTQTFFRNMLTGWSHGDTMSTTPILLRSFVRAYNVVGNVMGQPGYHTQYQTYATSKTAVTGGGNEDTSIYSLGLAFAGGSCGTGANNTSPSCDPLGFSTMMRWGNYDTVTSGVKWDSTEASPAAVTYLNGNFSSSYFGSLAHTLPASLYYSSTPSWWPSGKVWPAVGPDVTSGNLGVCTGTYAGSQGTSAAQCSGGTLSTAYAGHANSNPAQDCYLNIMHGPPDGSGSALSFDASLCYASGTGTGTVNPPTLLSVTVQ